MAEVKYIISRDDIENTPTPFLYSKLDPYHTIRINEEGKETFNGYVSEYMVRNGVDGIPTFEINKWINAVESFIYEHNDKVNSGNGFDVKFNITSVDSRFAYTYEEIVNGKIVKSGTGWGLDFDTKVETDAWIDAVIEYNKKNGIKMPTDKIREKLNKLKESIKSLDSELSEIKGLELPMISVALPSLDSDPCEFVSKVKEAAENTVATIAGAPSPKDIINHNIKIIKENIYKTASKMCDAQTQIVEDSAGQINTAFNDSVAYWAEADAYRHQIEKEEAESVVTFEISIDPSVKVPINFMYDDAENTDDDGGMYLPSGDIPIVEISDSDRAIEYKEITYLNIYNPRANYGEPQENYIAKQHIGDAMKNLWVPLRKGWQEYATNTLHIDPTWHISSGYRPRKYNDNIIHASATSAHKYGYAIDVQLSRFLGSGNQKRTAARYLSGFIKAFLQKNRHIQFDQILIEYSGGSSLATSSTSWVHIGYKNPSGSTRRQFVAYYNANSTRGNKFAAEIL